MFVCFTSDYGECLTCINSKILTKVSVLVLHFFDSLPFSYILQSSDFVEYKRMEVLREHFEDYQK